MLRAAVARTATKLAEDRLTVFAFDGVESMDPESLALLRRLLDDAKPARIVLLLSFRPGTTHPLTDLEGYDEITLGPLADADVARLTALRLNTEEVSTELRREVAAKSGGNPLYVEEYLNALEDAGAIGHAEDGSVTFRPEVAAVEVPKTLRGIVAARLARLPEEARELLHVASLASGRFTGRLLARVTDRDDDETMSALEELALRQLITRQSVDEWSFAHEMVGEVLRDQLPVEVRRSLQGAIAEALEALYPEHLDEMAERLAQHHRKAGQRDRAVDFLERAADRLEAEKAIAGAVAQLVRAIETLDSAATPDRARQLALYRRIGVLCLRGRLFEEGSLRMGRAYELADELERSDYVALFAMIRGRLAGNANRFEEGQRWFDRARQVARQLDDRGLLRDVTAASAEAHARNGDYGRAIALLREALELARETGDEPAQIRCLIPLALAYGGTGEREPALGALGEARSLVGATPDGFTECELLKAESLVSFFVGDRHRAIEAAGQAMELAKEYGFPYEAAVNAHNMGEGYLQVGDYKRAFALLRYSYETARDHGHLKLAHTNMRALGFIDAIKFGSEEGRQRIVDACRFAEDHGYLWEIIQAKHMLATVDHHQGREDDALAGFREVRRLAAEFGHRHYEQAAEEALDAIAAGRLAPLPADRA